MPNENHHNPHIEGSLNPIRTCQGYDCTQVYDEDSSTAQAPERYCSRACEWSVEGPPDGWDREVTAGPSEAEAREARRLAGRRR